MIPYVRDSFWRGRDFAGVTDMQTRALTWCTEVAGRRPHRSLDRAQPLAVFDAVESVAAGGLAPLPSRTFEVARWVSPKVAPDCHIQVEKVLYSVPWQHIGARTDTKVTERMVSVHVGGVLVKTWPRVAKGRCTDTADYPPEKIAFFSRNPVWCRTKAERIGPHTAELVDGLLAVQALHRLRSAQGIVALADKHDAERVEAACQLALAAGDPTYRTVRGILAAGTENTAGAADLNGPGGPSVATPAHLHGPDGLLAHLTVEDVEDVEMVAGQ